MNASKRAKSPGGSYSIHGAKGTARPVNEGGSHDRFNLSPARSDRIGRFARDLRVSVAIGYAPPLSERLYGGLMPAFSADATFKRKALEKIFASTVDLGIIDRSADISKLYTEELLPKR